MEERSKLVLELNGINFPSGRSKGITTQIALIFARERIPTDRIIAFPGLKNLQVFGPKEVPTEIAAEIRKLVQDLFPGSELDQAVGA